MHARIHTISISCVAARGLLYTYTRADALVLFPRGFSRGGEFGDEVAIGCAVGVCVVWFLSFCEGEATARCARMGRRVGGWMYYRNIMCGRVVAEFLPLVLALCGL